jgi:hypothetical protein
MAEKGPYMMSMRSISSDATMNHCGEPLPLLLLTSVDSKMPSA